MRGNDHFWSVHVPTDTPTTQTFKPYPSAGRARPRPAMTPPVLRSSKSLSVKVEVGFYTISTHARGFNTRSSLKVFEDLR